MTEWIYDQQSQSGELRLTADLTIEEVASFKQAMLQAFDTADQVTLNLEDVACIDVAGLQIICACHRFGETRQKQLRLQTGENRVFARIVRETGFAQWAVRCFGEEQAGFCRDA